MTIPADPDPDQVTDTLNQSRAFATVTVPSAGLPNIVTIASLSRQTRLMLASADGYFYIYNIPEEGGDCVMVKQHRVDPECSEVAAAGQPSLTPPDSPAVIPVTQVGGASGGVYSVSTVQYSTVKYMSRSLYFDFCRRSTPLAKTSRLPPLCRIQSDGQQLKHIINNFI